MRVQPTIPTGNYSIRAYTDYQKNFGEDAFYHKMISFSKVKNSFETFEGGHVDKLTERIQTKILPYFSEILISEE